VENKERLIMKQVSLKAATRLVNAKSPSECDSLGYAEEVVAVATFFNEWLLEGADQVITASKPSSAGNGAVLSLSVRDAVVLFGITAKPPPVCNPYGVVKMKIVLAVTLVKNIISKWRGLVGTRTNFLI